MANPTQRQIREIKVIADVKGGPDVKKMADSFGQMNKSVKQSADVLTRFNKIFNAFAGLSFAGIGVKNITETLDAMQKLNDRLTLSEGSADGAKRALEGIVSVAGNTKSSIQDIATVYNRLNLSLGESGISSEALLGLTNALSNSFRLSGATAAEAAAATIQLSQGLASGQLRGQELRSVLEQNALAGDILAKQFGTTRGKLLKYSEAVGGLDAGKVLQAFANEAEALNEAAEKLRPTIGETLVVAFDQLKLRVHDANEAMGLSEKIIKAINFAFGNLEWIIAATAALYLYAKGAAIFTAAVTKIATAFFAVISIGLKVVAFFATLIATINPVTVVVGALALAIVGMGGGFDYAIKKGREFFEWTGLITKQKSDVDKMKESWYAATSATNNYVTSAKKNGTVIKESLNPALGDFAQNLILQSANLKQLPGPIEKMTQELGDFAKTFKGASETTIDFDEALSKLNQQFLKDKNINAYNTALKALKIDKLNEDFRKGKVDKEAYDKKLNEINFGKASKSANELRLDLKELNAAFAAGTLSLGDYASKIENAKMDKLNRDLRTGKTTALEFNEALNGHYIAEYNRAAAEGAITMDTFINETRSLQLAKLNQDFATGKIGVIEYNKALVQTSEQFNPNAALSVGLTNYIESAGTVSQNIANGITQTFGTLEEYFNEFTKSGKFKFSDFAKSVLDDLQKIITRALIIRPLAQGLLSVVPTAGASAGASGTVTGTSAATARAVAAHGAVFDGMKTNFFANGGVVNGRTGFGYGGGQSGMMGEKGPEAILPLRRDSGGNLGVASAPVIVNITNQTGGEVEQKESRGPNGEKMIDIIIKQKIKEQFASGAMDKQMAQSYGLRRKGV